MKIDVPVVALILLLAGRGCLDNPGSRTDLEGSFFNIDTVAGGAPMQVARAVDHWSGTGWRGEKLSTQLWVRSGEKPAQLSIRVTNLVGPGGSVISSDRIDVYSMESVKTDEFGEGCEKAGVENYDSSYVADVLIPVSEMDTVYPSDPGLIWISVSIPVEAEPGSYNGSLFVKSRSDHDIEFTLEIEVLSPGLLGPEDWSYHLDLWQNPFAEARFHQVDLWSEEHFSLMRPTLELLASAGQKCITTSITDKPWGGQTFDPFYSMISRVRESDGSWTYDYANFDAWVAFAMDCGIQEQINCYSMVSWSNTYTYYDAEQGAEISVNCRPGSEEYSRIWVPFLKDFYKHLKAKGWENKTTISMDERSLEDLQEVLKLVQNSAPGLKIAFAGHYHPELDHRLYDISVASKHVVPQQNLNRRRESGSKTTFYVCCVEEYPNTFTFSNPSEATYLSWYAAFIGFDGMLRWSYNSWTRDPFEDSRFRRFPAGDTYMVYPGGISSVRFERLREGIQDFEKIRILKTDLTHEGTDEAQNKLARLNKLLEDFKLENLKTQSAAESVYKGKMLINQLSE